MIRRITHRYLESNLILKFYFDLAPLIFHYFFRTNNSLRYQIRSTRLFVSAISRVSSANRRDSSIRDFHSLASKLKRTSTQLVPGVLRRIFFHVERIHPVFRHENPTASLFQQRGDYHQQRLFAPRDPASRIT